MRKIAALALALAWSQAGNASLEEDGIWAAGVWETTVWADGVWLEGEAGLIAVPSVVGQASAAAADTILEGDGLDLGTETEACSAAADNEIIRQNPAAGVEVALGTLVDVVSSSGAECTGKPLSISVRKRLGL